MIRSEASKKTVRREMGRYFKKCRKGAKLSQVEVGLELGISPQYLSNFENGRSTLSFQHVKRLVVLYSIGIDALVRVYLLIVKQVLESDYKDCRKIKNR
ncbi:MAG: helix-turn-helix transcriptional regulator [Bdellovibrionaceae bacterium]|nr:helix-turn-helix transcriptional regulator [Pseudobdellovibrionaceae bacterium]